jgi:hypothetical protein
LDANESVTVGINSGTEFYYSEPHIDISCFDRKICIRSKDIFIEKCKIFDVSGKLIKSNPINSSGEINISCKEFSNGICFIHIIGENISFTRKIFIK